MKKAKVVNSRCASSRVRGVCKPNGPTHTGIFNTGLSDPARARARDAQGRALARQVFHEAVIAEWRERIFAEGIEDPVKVAVQEAVKDFGQEADFVIWAWYANRIGINCFLNLYFEQKSVMRTRTLRNPAAAFHARLKRFYAAYAPKEGQPSVALAEEGGRHV